MIDDSEEQGNGFRWGMIIWSDFEQPTQFTITGRKTSTHLDHDIDAVLRLPGTVRHIDI